MPEPEQSLPDPLLSKSRQKSDGECFCALTHILRKHLGCERKTKRARSLRALALSVCSWRLKCTQNYICLILRFSGFFKQHLNYFVVKIGIATVPVTWHSFFKFALHFQHRVIFNFALLLTFCAICATCYCFNFGFFFSIAWRYFPAWRYLFN